MKVLVTGSNGFIGSHLAEALARRGDEVFCLVRKTSRTDALAGLNVRLVVGDGRDKESLRPAVRGMDCVFHLAGVINAVDWPTYFEANTLGTQNLIEACLEENPRLRKFVFISSISALGPSPCGTALREEDECRPVSDYGRSKLMAEKIVLGLADRLPVTIIRPSNIIGPRQKELFESIKLLAKRIKPLIGTGGPQTSLAGVEDLVRAFILAADSPKSRGQIYLVTDGHAYAWRDITEAVAEALGPRRLYLKIPYPVQYVLAAVSELGARLGRTTPRLTRSNIRATRKYCWIYDGSKIERELGFKPAFNMKETVRRTVEWYRKEGMIE
ncbi:MAG: NAD-dependent epimerase/dehydratase family protein [Candidatus Aminicenantes bacterium]|nr:NAD-dependent epimerase/dehydratase family protein [Candidatus Aminicenantes bacterium]